MSSEERQERDYRDPMRGFHPSTAIIHAGYRSGLSEHAVKPPLFRTSTFEFPNAECGATFFRRAYHLDGDDGQEPGLVYSRINNPNIEIFEDKMVAAEVGAAYAALFPSGMSAITTAILALVPRGGRVLYTSPVYGGTYFFFKHLCPTRFGIETVSVDTTNVDATAEALHREGPFDMVFIETPANPTIGLTDIGAVADMARRQAASDLLIAVDNTFLGPVFQRPFTCGADLVLYSATKFIGGHSDLLAGVVLARARRHIDPIRDYRTILGAVCAPDTAWMLTRSLETVWLRMERQAEKAAAVARALHDHPAVEKVFFPTIQASSGGRPHSTYTKQCSGPGSVLSFVLGSNSRDAAYRVLDAVRICHLAVSLGGTETLIEHPRSMTHSDMTQEDLDGCGISEGMIRLSVGLESSDDIIEDLRRALEHAGA